MIAEKKYILTIISGNKNIVFGIFDNDTLIKKYRIGKPDGTSADEYAVFLRNCVSQDNIQLEQIKGIIIGITNHEVKRPLESMVKRVFKINPIFVSEGTKTGVKIDYRSGDGLSADRVANVVAVKNLYCIKDKATIIIDFGVKTVIDVINKKGDYIGGVITIGEDMVHESLSNLKTSFPRVESQDAPQVIGNTLKRSLQSGGYWTVVYAIKGYLTDFIKELDDHDPLIIVTGGYGDGYLPYISYKKVDYDLTLKGLKIIYDRNLVTKTKKIK